MNHWLKSKTLWVTVVVLAFSGFGLVKKSETLPTERLGTVDRGDLIQRVTIAGSVSPDHKTMISAPYSAYVKKLYVQIGEKVKAGDPVVSLTQSLTGIHEDVYPIRAPIDGTVVQVLKMEGEYVDSANTNGTGIGIVRIDDLRHLHIDANSPEFAVEKLRVGQEVVIKASSILNRTYKGKIKYISLAAKEQKDWDKSRVEFSVLIDVQDADAQLEPGMSVVCDIVANKATNVLTLKHEFLQKEGDSFFVVTEDGRKKQVQVGLQNEEAFEIKSGIKEGEKVRQTDFLALAKSKI
jgi:multidrug efflux pump subunit AcrA (membrane-fusion protein)